MIIKKADSLLTQSDETIRVLTDFQKELDQARVRVLTESQEELANPDGRVLTKLQKDIPDQSVLNEEVRNTSFNNLSIAGNLVSDFSKKKVCMVTGIDISMQKDNSRFLNISGIRHIYKYNRDLYDKLLSEIPVKFHTASRKVQEYKIAYHVRDKFFNPRNRIRRGIKKLCKEKALFDNMDLISKQKLALANTP